MRMARAIRATLGTALLAGTVLMTSAAGASAATDDTAYWRVSTNGVRGLVTFEGADPGVLSFHLFGLKPNHRYKLVGHTVGCGKGSSPAVSRRFRTNATGLVWDPVPAAASFQTLRSMRIKDRATGATVACANRTALGDGAVKLDVDIARVRGLVVVDTTGTARLLLTASGLTPGASYTVRGANGGCDELVTLTLFERTFTANAKGLALKVWALGPEEATQPVSVSFRSVPSGDTVACG